MVGAFGLGHGVVNLTAGPLQELRVDKDEVDLARDGTTDMVTAHMGPHLGGRG